jgi:hypothetical protein
MIWGPLPEYDRFPELRMVKFDQVRSSQLAKAASVGGLFHFHFGFGPVCERAKLILRD